MPVSKKTSPNIGPWEKSVAEQHNLHESWLVPSCRGTVCQCCHKLRDFEHYVTDTGVCVFCSAACGGKPECQSKTFVQGSEIDQCRSMGEIEKALTLGRPIPQHLVQHTSACEHCLFWLSWGMAIKGVVFTTNRLRFPDCPAVSEFQYALMVAARGIRATGGLIDKSSMGKFQHVSPAEFGLTFSFQTHLDECELCSVYWHELIHLTITAQREYEDLLEDGQTASPPITDTAEEIEIPRLNFVSDQSQRPS